MINSYTTQSDANNYAPLILLNDRQCMILRAMAKDDNLFCHTLLAATQKNGGGDKDLLDNTSAEFHIHQLVR
jgi:hypothetical protein